MPGGWSAGEDDFVYSFFKGWRSPWEKSSYSSAPSTPSPTNPPPSVSSSHRVFISYAREDYHHAKAAYDFLTQNGCKPWLDKADLIPGQDWKLEITKAISSSDLVVVFFSSDSVAKTGYIQVEYRFTIDMLCQKAEGTIYIVPVLVDSCEPPSSFQRLHWIYCKDPDWCEQIAKTLSHIKPK